MSQHYMEWVKDNWQKAAILVLVYIVATLLPLYSRLERIEFMLLLAFPLYLIHEIEEYILPGGFPDFFNENLLNVNPEEGVVPVDREVIFWINLIYIWLIVPLFTGLGFVDYGLAAWIPYFLFFQAFAHLGMGIKGKMLLNPGIRSSFLLHVPYAVVLIGLLRNEGVIINPIFNLYMAVGFVFNALLPIFAKVFIVPRYQNRVKNIKKQ